MCLEAIFLVTRSKREKCIRDNFYFCVFMISLFLIIGISRPLYAYEEIKSPQEESLKKILIDFEQYATHTMKTLQVPGMAIAIVRGDETIYQKAFGVKTLGKGDPVTVHTLFQIGSTSKAFTATLVGMMVDAKKMQWHDRVKDHLSHFEMYDPWVTVQFTVTDVIAQRSGLPEHAGDNAIFFLWSRPQIIHALRWIKPATSFRSEYAYQNGLFLVAASLIEKCTGMTWERTLQERIFKPLGMMNSSSDKLSFQKAKDVTSLHTMVNDTIVALPKDWSMLDWTYTCYGPAGGINSNVVDMTKWLRFQWSQGVWQGKQLISKESLAYLHAPKTIMPQVPFCEFPMYYGQGWIYTESSPYPVIWHNGGTSGCKTMVAFIPQEKLGIVVLTNLADTLLPEALAWRFFASYFDRPYRDWLSEAMENKKQQREKVKETKPPVSPLPAMPLETYVGNYYHEIYGEIHVVKEKDNLVVIIGPQPIKLWLSHWNRDVFVGSWDISTQWENVGFVCFQISAQGTPESMSIDAFKSGDCDGVFRKKALAKG